MTLVPPGAAGDRGEIDHEMGAVGRSVGHAIVLTSPEEMVEISHLMETAGFRMGDEVVESSLGLRCRLMPIGGGGFIELASEISSGSFVHGNPFERTPRLASVSYTCEDVASELARWRQLPGGEKARAACGSWRREDGTLGYHMGISPTPPAGDVFFALRDVALFPLPYPDDAGSAPQITRITISGKDADLWRQQHIELFGLPERDGSLWAGKTEVCFEQNDAAARTELSIALRVPNPEVAIPLVAGRFFLE